MLDALKTLFENQIVSEEVRAEIEEAWDAKVRENRQVVTAELREEFAQKYEHDKQVMIDAIDSMVSESLANEIAEFAEERSQLDEAKVSLHLAMKKNMEDLNNFVAEQLATEIKELREDKRRLEEQTATLEEFIVEALSSEITEFYEDKKDLAETKVKLIRESKASLEKTKKDFIEKSARLVSETVSSTLEREMSTLKEDIDMARKNDFGRKIFEAFSAEFSNSYINENSEMSRLQKVLDLKDKQLAEAKQLAQKAKTLAESKDRENKRILESAKREKILNNLVGPLSRDQRSIMMDLLESVQTDKLQSSFDKYLPAVIDGAAPVKRKSKLVESTEVTGNRETTHSSIADDNVVDIRRLAGLS